jgi:hypothetical protein
MLQLMRAQKNCSFHCLSFYLNRIFSLTRIFNVENKDIRFHPNINCKFVFKNISQKGIDFKDISDRLEHHNWN